MTVKNLPSKIKPIPAQSVESQPIKYFKNPETGVREPIENWSSKAIGMWISPDPMFRSQLN